MKNLEPSLISPIVKVGKVRDFNDDQLDDFMKMIENSGEVSKIGLRERVRSATLIALCTNNEKLFGGAALKGPSRRYLEYVFSAASVTIPHGDVLELGWLNVTYSEREKGIGTSLVENLLRHAPAGLIISTVRSGNMASLNLLKRFGFINLGMAYPGVKHGTTINLLIYHPHSLT